MLAVLALLITAQAQQPVDVGVVKQSDAIVVQKLLYPKAHATEIASSIGVLPFDAYSFAPLVQVETSHHLTEEWSVSALVGFGYGVKTPTYVELEQEYGIAPYAYGYVGSLLVGGAWAPIYAKASVDGARVFHFDVYLTARAGVTMERSLIPEGGRPIAPTLSPGLGTRVFLGRTIALRLEVRDDVLFQWRKLTQEMRVPQNVGLYAGLSTFAKRKAK